MSSRRKDSFSEAIVGLFMLAVLALLVYFTIVISGVDVLHGRERVNAVVTFRDVGGLKDRDSVMYRGMKVGTVEHMELGPEGIKVFMEINRDVVLRERCRISVCSLSMLGGNYLLLEEGSGEALPLDSTVFTGETPTDWMRDLSSIASSVKEITSGGEIKSIVTNIEAASVSIRKVSERVERGEGTLGKLLSSEDSVYSDLKTVMTNLAAVTTTVREGKGTLGKLLSDDETVYADLKTVMTNLAAVTTTVKEGKGTLGKLLSEDDSVYKDLQKTLADASAVTERLKNGEGFIGRLLAKDDPIYGEFDSAVKAFRKASESFDAKEAMDGANRLLASLNAVADRINSGEGTLGRLVNEEDLYNEVKGLTKDVRQVVDNFRDTTPISTFGSLIMGGL